MDPTSGGLTIAYVSSAGTREILPFRLEAEGPRLVALTPIRVTGGDLPLYVGRRTL